MTGIVNEIIKKNRIEFTKNFGRRFINFVSGELEDSSVEGTHLCNNGIGRLIGYIIYSPFII